jgi:RimJ/RimL family protein N-acetyltransferase
MRFYPNREVIEQLLTESATDPHLKGLRKLSTSDIVPIYYSRRPVGFYAPTQAIDGSPRMGRIYVEPDYRGKGIAFRAALDFQQKNPDMVWFSEQTNTPSIELARKLGLKYQGRARGNKDVMIFKK